MSWAGMHVEECDTPQALASQAWHVARVLRNLAPTPPGWRREAVGRWPCLLPKWVIGVGRKLLPTAPMRCEQANIEVCVGGRHMDLCRGLGRRAVWFAERLVNALPGCCQLQLVGVYAARRPVQTAGGSRSRSGVAQRIAVCGTASGLPRSVHFRTKLGTTLLSSLGGRSRAKPCPRGSLQDVVQGASLPPHFRPFGTSGSTPGNSETGFTQRMR